MPKISFAGYTLDLERQRLLRGGGDVALRPKSLALLTYLLANPGRIIGKEELISAVWQGMAVTDDSLTQCMKDIRNTLGPAADGLIRTVPRRGYVVEEGRVAKADEASSAAPASVAVLGFRPLGADREHQWFCEGVAEDITTTLTRSRRLLVVPHYRPAIRFDDAASSVQIARNLGASHALEGSVRLAGDRARIAAHLLEARTAASSGRSVSTAGWSTSSPSRTRSPRQSSGISRSNCCRRNGRRCNFRAPATSRPTPTTATAGSWPRT